MNDDCDTIHPCLTTKTKHRLAPRLTMESLSWCPKSLQKRVLPSCRPLRPIRATIRRNECLLLVVVAVSHGGGLLAVVVLLGGGGQRPTSTRDEQGVRLRRSVVTVAVPRLLLQELDAVQTLGQYQPSLAVFLLGRDVAATIIRLPPPTSVLGGLGIHRRRRPCPCRRHFRRRSCHRCCCVRCGATHGVVLVGM